MSLAKKNPLSEWFQEHIAEFDPLGGLSPYVHDGFIDWIGEFGISRGLTLSLMFASFLLLLNELIPDLPLFALGWLIGTAPIWLPIALWIGAWKAWINYIRSHFLSTRHPVLLEVKLPREIYKSPRAMEVVFSNLFANSGETGFLVRSWLGSVFPWFSFEVASFGGDIHFYVWCWKTYRRLVESSIYAEYPEVEIVEVEDYTLKFKFDPEVHTCFAGDYIYFGRGWPGDEYPVRSYVDFELDKDPKEEHKVDPLSEMFELLSSLKPHEQMWIQMNFRFMARQEPGILIRKKIDWPQRVKREVEKLRAEGAVFSEETHLTPEQERVARPRPTWRHSEMIHAMERHLGKQPFEIGMRHIYISAGEFHGPTYTGMRWIFKALNSPNYMNYIRSRRGHNPFDYPWQDFHDYRWNLVTRRYIDMMRRRSFFYTPWSTTAQVMSTEMMATLYHYPSSAIKSPGITRMPSKKAEPPANLPR